MPTEITVAFLQDYLVKNKKHRNYDSTVKMFNEIRVHADGETPDELLMQRRPGESSYIFDYRKQIYQPKTKRVIGKIINSLSKINRSVDWNIKYDSKTAKGLLEKNSLQDYCENKYPRFKSLTEWIFGICLKQYLIDPNAVALVRVAKQVDAASFPEPTIEIFNSDRVYDYVDGEYCVLLSKDTCSYTENNVTYDDGQIYFIDTPEATYKYCQANKAMTRWDETDLPHNTPGLCAFKLGGLVKEAAQEFLYESRINAVIPSLNSAVVVYSDKQAELVQHVHSLMWQYQTQNCKSCNGVGTYKPNADSSPIQCPECKGNGTIPTSPYESLVMNSSTGNNANQPVPIPLAGYIQKTDVALMIKAMSDEIKQEIHDAYEAVSMEFLDSVPLAESGIAKSVDRDDLNNFVHRIATDIVSIMNSCYEMIARLRYGYSIKDEQRLKEMCPTVAIPQKFDLLSDTFLIDEIAKLRNAQVDPTIIAAVEAEYSAKKFRDNDELQNLIQAAYELNPCPGVNDENLMLRLQNGGVDQRDYIIYCNLFPFIRRAANENENFYTLTSDEQTKILEGYADEKKDSISGDDELKAAAQAPAAIPPGVNPPAPNPDELK